MKIHEEENPLNQEECGFGLWMVTRLQRDCSGGGNTAGYKHQGVDKEVFSHTKLLSPPPKSISTRLFNPDVCGASKQGWLAWGNFRKGARDV